METPTLIGYVIFLLLLSGLIVGTGLHETRKIYIETQFSEDGRALFFSGLWLIMVATLTFLASFIMAGEPQSKSLMVPVSVVFVLGPIATCVCLICSVTYGIKVIKNRFKNKSAV